jgi:hypothetical protein
VLAASIYVLLLDLSVDSFIGLPSVTLRMALISICGTFLAHGSSTCPCVTPVCILFLTCFSTDSLGVSVARLALVLVGTKTRNNLRQSEKADASLPPSDFL